MTVGVVIPCYNAAVYVRRAVQSVLENGSIVEKIICVDNNSTDGTLEELMKLKSDYGEIIDVISEDRKGANWARNKGLESIDSTWVQFLDADDVISSNKLDLQAQCGERLGGDVIYSPYFTSDSSGNIEARPDVENEPILALVTGLLGITSSNLFRTQTVKKVGGWNPDWSSSQEYELMFRLLKRGAVFIPLQERLMTYSKDVPNQISSGPKKNRRENSLRLRAQMIDEFLNREEANSQQLLNGYFNHVRWVYPYNRELALREWRHLKDLNYHPTPSLFLPLTYCLLLRVIGFELAEKTRITISKYIRHAN